MKILINNGRIIDPSCNTDETACLLIEDGRIIKKGSGITRPSGKDDVVIDASNKMVFPALVDLHCHLREPGREDEETIETGSRAAARGGFSHICCMPNTSPPADTESVVDLILMKAERCGIVNVLPIACITKKREGKELSEMALLKSSGAVAFSDDGDHVTDSSVMRAALSYSKMLSSMLISHCEDRYLSKGVIHSGGISALLGLSGIPAIAEEIAVVRDIRLAEDSGGRLHIAHISTEGAVEAVRQAKAKGISVTCEACPHHFSLTDEAARGMDTNMKMSPPLRTRDHVDAVIQGLKDGTIDAIATDHAPHSSAEKELAFDSAPFGTTGLETALSVGITYLVDAGVLSMLELVSLMSTRPARILGIEAGTLEKGCIANVVVVDCEKEWEVTEKSFVSKSKNSCFTGQKLKGVVEHLIVSGKVVKQ